MIVYVAVTAVLNVTLGFVLAVYLAKRYRRLTMPTLGTHALGSPSAELWTNEAAPLPAPPPAPDGVIAAPLGPEASEAVEEAGSEQGASADSPAQLRPPDTPKPTQAQEEHHPTVRTIEELQEKVERYNQRLTDLEAELIQSETAPNAQSAESCRGSLRAANREYLESVRPVQHDLSQALAQEHGIGNLRQEFQTAVDSQEAQIREVEEALAALSLAADPAGACRKMRSHTSKLRATNVQVRDALGNVLGDLRRPGNEVSSPDKPLTDPQAPPVELLDRSRLEARLVEIWKEDPQRDRPVSLVMVDLDRFGAVNERFGRETGDRILRAIRGLIAAESRHQSVPAQLSGQQFVVLLPDTDPRTAVNTAERIRQIIEMSHFRYRDADIRVTVSCSVVSGVGEDDSDSLLARAEATLQEAKRYGRNRTFVHEGKYPTPVVPPSFSLEPRAIEV